MKQAISLLFAGSAISLAGAAFAGTASAPAHAFVFEGPAAGAATIVGTASGAPLWRVSGDDDEGEDGEGWFFSKSAGGSSGDEEDDDGCEDDDDDEGGCAAGAAGNAAPAGSVAPPKNGLFTNGTAPQVKTN